MPDVLPKAKRFEPVSGLSWLAEPRCVAALGALLRFSFDALLERALPRLLERALPRLLFAIPKRLVIASTHTAREGRRLGSR